MRLNFAVKDANLKQKKTEPMLEVVTFNTILLSMGDK